MLHLVGCFVLLVLVGLWAHVQCCWTRQGWLVADMLCCAPRFVAATEQFEIIKEKMVPLEYQLSKVRAASVINQHEIGV